jgi:hypothetical protein
LRLGRGLSIVLTHILVICSTEADCALLAFMTDVNAHKHSLFRNFRTKLHSPKITSEFSIHLSNDIQENSVVILSDCAVCNKLGDYRGVAIDLVLDVRIKVLVVRVIGHYYKEYELRVLDQAV